MIDRGEKTKLGLDPSAAIQQHIEYVWLTFATAHCQRCPTHLSRASICTVFACRRRSRTKIRPNRIYRCGRCKRRAEVLIPNSSASAAFGSAPSSQQKFRSYSRIRWPRPSVAAFFPSLSRRIELHRPPHLVADLEQQSRPSICHFKFTTPRAHPPCTPTTHTPNPTATILSMWVAKPSLDGHARLSPHAASTARFCLAIGPGVSSRDADRHSGLPTPHTSCPHFPFTLRLACHQQAPALPLSATRRKFRADLVSWLLEVPIKDFLSPSTTPLFKISYRQSLQLLSHTSPPFPSQITRPGHSVVPHTFSGSSPGNLSDRMPPLAPSCRFSRGLRDWFPPVT
ncbi:unnamed protein product [Trichogramma brassicae]|uniref:Uncharacterized protein n=1 Tax=Trichogramma brassicae TaxID=86971 RepID=A0A6H5HX21_9HYME|nr:unnamed protein product [Trichogramma brassicae]